MWVCERVVCGFGLIGERLENLAGRVLVVWRERVVKVGEDGVDECRVEWRGECSLANG